MSIYNTIKKQHKKIKELSYILNILIHDKSFCEMETTCDLFFSYSTMVDQYMKTVETNVYRYMLVHNDPQVKKTAHRFMAGSCGIKRIFSEYLKSWCRNKQLRVKNHQQFVQETEDIFNLISQRINDEKKHLYPVVKEMACARKKSRHAEIA